MPTNVSIQRDRQRSRGPMRRKPFSWTSVGMPARRPRQRVEVRRHAVREVDEVRRRAAVLAARARARQTTLAISRTRSQARRAARDRRRRASPAGAAARRPDAVGRELRDHVLLW
jgi:hypothetical protein